MSTQPSYSLDTLVDTLDEFNNLDDVPTMQDGVYTLVDANEDAVWPSVEAKNVYDKLMSTVSALFVNGDGSANHRMVDHALERRLIVRPFEQDSHGWLTAGLKTNHGWLIWG